MRLLLDTHSFLWWVFGDKALSPKANAAIANSENQVFVSAASAWEITTKFRIGKLDHAAIVAEDIAAAVREEGFQELAILFSHTEAAGALQGDHRDPFDRVLIAQAMLESMSFVSNEVRFDAFPVRRLW